jgi:hypothetical protein
MLQRPHRPDRRKASASERQRRSRARRRRGLVVQRVGGRVRVDRGPAIVRVRYASIATKFRKAAK